MYRRLDNRLDTPGPSEKRDRWRPLTVLAIAIVVFAVVVAGVVFLGPRLGRAIAPDSGVFTTDNFESAVSGVLDLIPGSSFGGGTEESDATPTPGATATPPAETPAPTPPPIDLDSVTGSPYSATTVVQAWRSAGITVTQEPLEHAGFQELAGEALGLRLDTGSGSVLLAAVVYPDSDAVKQDWSTGERPELREGKTLPPRQSVWWNRNVVAVILERQGSTSEALDAFIDMGR